MLVAQLLEDGCAGGVAVAEDARQVALCDQSLQQFGREAVLVFSKVTPFKQHRHTGHFPVPGRSVFAARQLTGVAVGALDLTLGGQAGREHPGT